MILKNGLLGLLFTLLISCGVSDGPSLNLSLAPKGPLASLLLSTGSLKFDSLTSTYAVTVAHGTGNMILTPTVSSAYPGATVTVNGSAATSGSPATAVSLGDGSNTLTIVITSAAGVILKTYTVNVIQNGPPGFGAVAPIASSYPYGTVILGGHFLYGITNSDGANSQGTVFKIKTDGTGYQDLHDFGGAGDGTNSLGSLILSSDGGILYGMTSAGGLNNHGVIFSIHTDGTAYTILHNFTGADGGDASGNSLIISGNSIYGMTSGGGASGNGSIFSIQADGTNYNLLYSFSTTDGTQPSGELTLIGTKFYGAASSGGDTSTCGGSGCGTIFSINKDGSSFQVLHTFQEVDGGYSRSQLLNIGSNLFGVTTFRGSANEGTIFKIGLDGTGFEVIHNFVSGAADGGQPHGSLTSSADQNTLYGWTSGGGASGNGVLFSLPTNATSATPITLIHTFAGGTNDGKFPYQGAPVLIGSTLYGMTQEGGVGDSGFIFSFGF